MTRLIPLLIAAVPLVAFAAPIVPGTAGKGPNYQKLADEAPWRAPESGDDFRRCLAHELNDYQLEVVRKKEGRWEVTIRVLDGGKELYAWDGHLDSVFFARGDVLYHADYGPISSGCAVVAFDLKAKKQLWKTSLKGLGPIHHSKYRNQVRMDRINGEVFAVYGRESAGRYVEILDLKTGKTVGHKVFKDDE
ncbi:MAG TPA: hypothetical protein VKD90_10875 [Gemmataceae bacterium]|nr:hypothetical protein [Gemmataceae bacterium]